MLEKAIKKLKTEMDSSKNNTYGQVVGGFLIEHLIANPSSAEKILNADKTIGLSLGEMKKVAEKRRIGSCAVLTDQEGFGIVLKYFGIESSITNIPSKIKEPAVEAPVTKKKESEIDFNVELDF
ncbi:MULTISPECIES: hypothetical protein [Clostridium]|uniref:hypothetical protein n=1 Tax=Clostridium TaxID=1485 RepID=UPI0013E932AF|nr:MULTISPECIES: hypothetical protein [Clostridium]MBU3126771.1 hypothetical protein [Clostridium tagluense]MBZ9633164.1 hypothetical protein [Clostridium sp. FP1]